ARAPVRRATAVARAVPMAMTGRPGKRISLPPPRRRCSPRPGSSLRGNHEICSRAGAYFRLLDPTPAQTAPPCIDLIPHFTVTVADQSFIVLDSTNAADACPSDSDPYAAEFAGMRPAPGSWLLTYRPVWGFRSHRKTINATLQQALAAFDGQLPDGIALA